MQTNDEDQRICVAIQIPVNVTSFGGIGFVASALSQVQNILNSVEEVSETGRYPRKRSYELEYFRVESPPEAQILSDPSWLGVLIGSLSLGLGVLQTIGSYSKIKEGWNDIANDLGELKKKAASEVDQVISGISGLTDNQLSNIKIGAHLYLEKIFSLASEDREIEIKKASRIAHTLGNRKGKRVQFSARKSQKRRNG